MKRTQIYLEADQERRLAARAITAGTTKSLLIREAIESYLTSSTDDASRLAAFRDALDAVEATPAALPDGASYVQDLRSADLRRGEELERRRR